MSLSTLIAELEEALKAATAGPWFDIDGGGDISDRPAHVVCRADSGTPWFIADMQDDLGGPPEGFEGTSTGPGGCPVANARLIALMRNSLPTLIEAVKRQGEALEAMLEEKCDYMRINNLGDPETQHTVKLARAALTAHKEKSDV